MNLHEIDALLDGVKGRRDHAEAPHNPDMLALIRAAEQMRAYIAGIHGDDLDDPMPVFVLKGKDRLALRAVHTYVDACDQADLPRQACEVLRAADEMAAWQDRNPDRLKLPDHGHVPVGEALLTAGE